MITVIIPVYNAQKYLRECLDSLVNQTYKDIEVITVNDGSTDNSGVICHEYAEKYNNFFAIDKENGGQMSAWILGVQHAHGEFFGFVDSDDYVDPTMYEEMMHREEETGADLVMCNFFDFDLKAATPRHADLKEYYGENDIHEIYEKVFPSLTEYISTSRWDKLFKRDIFIENMKKYCAKTVRTMEDRFIVSSSFFSCNSFAYVSKPLYYWRRMKISSSRKARPELCDIMELLYSTQVQMLKDKGYYEQYKNHVEVGKIDLIRAIIERNIGAALPYAEKKRIAMALLTESNRRIVLAHKDECKGKFGKYIYWSYKFNNPTIMVVGASLFYSINKRKQENGFCN